DVGTLSFFPSKNLGGWGDGGMILARDGQLAGRLRKLRLHGGAKQYHHEEVGYNSRLDTLQAAVLLVKPGHLAGWSAGRPRGAGHSGRLGTLQAAVLLVKLGRLAGGGAGRRRVAARDDALLEGIEQVKPPVVDPANEHIFHQYAIRAERRDALVEHLRRRGIGCAVYYPIGLHLQPCFADLGYRRGSLPVTEQAMAEVVSLPVYPELSDAQQDAVVAAIREFYA